MTKATNSQVRRLLEAELAGITTRLPTGPETPETGLAAADFFDVAQVVEHQELANLTASRLVERARRLRMALERVDDGEYGVCAECGTPIPSRRLSAVPDATTCLACQERLESDVSA
jgi:DnaK suppressor protein